jgi:glycosyltransferase involved in cell wall biosynthesis
MKVLHFHHSLDIGGTESLLLDIFRNSNKEKINMDLCLLKSGGILLPEFQAIGVRPYVLNSFKKYDFTIPFKLSKMIKHKQYDIIHAHNLMCAIYATQAAKKIKNKNIKVFFTIHGFRKKVNKYYLPLKHKLLIKYLYHNQINFIAVSEEVRNYLESILGITREYSILLYNGIDFKKLDTTEADENLIKFIGDDFCIGMIGRFCDVKDYPTLIQAAALVLREFPKTKFVLVGDGPERIIIENLIRNLNLANHFLIYGFRRNIGEILNTIDLFALSSNSETFGISLIEAMYKGLPIVATDLPVFREIVVTGEDVILVPPKNSQEFAKAIIFLIRNPEQAKKLGLNSKKRAFKYSINNYLKELMNIYNTSLTTP